MNSRDNWPPLDPEVAAALSQFPSTSLPPTIEQLRSGAAYSGAITPWQKENTPSEEEYRVEDRMIPVDGGKNLVRVLIPTPSDGDSTQKYPLMVWFHGGGYCVGSVDIDDDFLRRMCVNHRIVIANVEYRLAPENPFPIGINDAYEGVKWAVENSSSLNASPSLGFIVGGCSAGANYAASAVLRARDDPLFSTYRITGQFLELPPVVHPNANLPEKFKSIANSWTENANAPLLGQKDMTLFLDALKADPDDPQYSVLLAPSHAKLPPAYMQVAGADPLRDEGLMYEKVLREADVETKLDFYAGYPHGGHYVLPKVALTQKFYQDFEEGLGWLLKRPYASAITLP